MSKYKYYFRKPTSEIVKDILRILAIAGAFYISCSSPRFVHKVYKNLIDYFVNFQGFGKYDKKRIRDTFYKLLKRGEIIIRKEGKQIYISLTEKGRKRANWMQIDALKLKKPKQWDKKWRLVIFDISELKRIHREAFRGKLKELNFYPLQKSVWVSPWPCGNEISLLRDFFGLSEESIRLIETNKIEKDDKLREFFSLK